MVCVCVCVCVGLQCCEEARGSYCEVVPEQLHDERAVFVRVFTQGIELCDGIIKGLQAHARTVVHIWVAHFMHFP